MLATWIDMKSALQIGTLTVLLLVAALVPSWGSLAGAVKPVVAQVEQSLNQRFPTLHALQIVLLHRQR
ncbi:MAG: hypothetical protein ACRD1L_02130 [Terriglobales bacterium]